MLFLRTHCQESLFLLPISSAKELGIKDTLPAYLDPTVLSQDLVTFASGGSGFDPMTPKLVVQHSPIVFLYSFQPLISYTNLDQTWLQTVISLSDQLKYLKEYIGKLEAMIGEEKIKFILISILILELWTSHPESPAILHTGCVTVIWLGPIWYLDQYWGFRFPTFDGWEAQLYLFWILMEPICLQVLWCWIAFSTKFSRSNWSV